MDARQQEPQQGQAPPPPSWYPHPSPPPPFPYHHHQQQQYAPPPPPPQQQQQPYGHLHYPTPPHPQQQHPPPYPQQHPPNMAMPLPPPPSYHQPPPPYPAGPPRYPQPPPPHPGAPHGYPPPPPNQSWGNSPWHYLQHWENQDRNIDYNDEEDWAARARAWAAAKSITENSLSAQFTPIGRTEIQNHIQHGLFQQPAGPPGEALHSSLSANQHLSTVSDPQRWATHVKESSSYAADSQASHASTSEGLVAEDTTPKQVKYGSTSYFFEQEVPSSYSTIPGEEIGNQYRQLKMPLPPSASSIQDGLHSSQSMQHFHSMSGQQPHMAYSGQFTASSTDPSDQPLVFEQRYSFDHDQDQKMNFRDTNTAGSLSGMDQIDAAPPIHAWAPPVGFSHIPAVPSGSQFDSSLGQLSSVPGNHPSVFGGNPGPSFHSNIPPPVGAQFGLGAGATIHPPAAFPEDVNGSFNYVERPKKASVPNWLREELIKKKAAIVSSAQEQPIGSFQAVGDDNSGKPFGKADQADSKSIESNRSAEDDEDDEDNVEAARAAAINQEIKRVLTDILLKVTDELFEEIATKVLDEDDLSVEVDRTVALSHQKVTSPVIITPKITAKVIVPGQDRSAKASNFEQSESASPRGNILGLANYASDEDDGNVEGPSIITSVPTEGISFNQVENNKTAEETVKTVEKGTAQERADPSGSSSVFRNGDGKGYSKEASKSESGYSELPISVHTGHADKIVSERNNCYPKETATAKIDTESTDTNVTNGQSLRDGSQEARSRAGSTNRSHDRSISRNDSIKKEKTGGEEFSAAHEHRRGETRDRMIEKMDRQVNFQKASKGHDFKEGKRIDASEYKKRNISESGRGDRRESEKDKKTGVKEDGDRKKENTKEDRRGQGGRDSHRSKSRHSPSPSSKVISGKDSSFASHGGASSGDVSEESRKRRPHSSRHSLSRSPPRSRRRQVSPSPHSKHSERRHSPNSYSDIRRRSRSASPVRRRK